MASHLSMLARPLAVSAFALSLALVGVAVRASGDGSSGEVQVSACTERAVAAIQRRYRATRDLRAKFRQQARSVALGRKGGASTARGTVQFSKPGKMRWSYEEPDPSLVVSNGSVMWIYDPERGEAQRLELGSGSEYFSGAGVRFLLGEGDILKEFRVTHDDCTGPEWELELVPRRESTYEKLRVRVDPRTGDLVQTRIVDLLGNETIVDFSDIEVNQTPDPSLFEFEPPAGVAVVDLTAPIPE